MFQHSTNSSTRALVLVLRMQVFILQYKVWVGIIYKMTHWTVYHATVSPFYMEHLTTKCTCMQKNHTLYPLYISIGKRMSIPWLLEKASIVNIDYRLPYTVVSDPVHLYSAAAVVVV